MIQRQLKHLLLLVAGEFWEDKASYLGRVQQLQISELVRIDDRYIPNQEVGLYFSAADVLVAPYRHMTGSAVVGLAKAFELPTIVVRESKEDESKLRSKNDDEFHRACMIARSVIEHFNANDQAMGSRTPTKTTCKQKERGWSNLVSAIVDASESH